MSEYKQLPKIIQIAIADHPNFEQSQIIGLDECGHVYARQTLDGDSFWELILANDKRRK